MTISMKQNDVGRSASPRPLLSLALVCLLVAGARAGVTQGEAPSPVQLATQIQGHLGSVPAAAQGDPNGLLAHLKGLGTTPENGFSVYALMEALSKPESFSSVESYISGAKTGSQPNLGPETVAAMEQWFTAIQGNAAAKKNFMSARRVMESQLLQLGTIDAASLKAFFDGDVAGAAAETSDEAGVEAPAAKPVGPGLAKPTRVARQTPIEPPTPQAQTQTKPTAKPVATTTRLAWGQAEKQVEEKHTLSAQEQTKVTTYVDQLMEIDPTDAETIKNARAGARTYASALSAATATESKMLQKSMREMTARGQNGKQIATSLLQLQDVVENLNPNQLTNWRRLLGKIPFIGMTVKKYMAKFQSGQGVILAIEESLKNGKAMLEEDNKTYEADEARMRALSRELKEAVAIAEEINNQLEARVKEEEATMSEEKRKFLQEEIMFPLRQRIQDLLSQVGVNQQGAMSAHLLLKNNEELIASIERTLNTVGPALRIGVTTAIGLDNQQMALEANKATKDMAANLLQQNAERLKTQGVAIQKDASEAAIDVEKLKAAFADLNTAMDDLSNYRREALGRMQEQIDELDRLTDEGEKVLKRIESAAGPRQQILAQFDPSRHLGNKK